MSTRLVDIWPENRVRQKQARELSTFALVVNITNQIQGVPTKHDLTLISYDHPSMSDNHDSSGTEHLTDLRAVCKREFVCSSPGQNNSALSV